MLSCCCVSVHFLLLLSNSHNFVYTPLISLTPSHAKCKHEHAIAASQCAQGTRGTDSARAAGSRHGPADAPQVQRRLRRAVQRARQLAQSRDAEDQGTYCTCP
jgi:hypothetical protein